MLARLVAFWKCGEHWLLMQYFISFLRRILTHMNSPLLDFHRGRRGGGGRRGGPWGRGRWGGMRCSLFVLILWYSASKVFGLHLVSPWISVCSHRLRIMKWNTWPVYLRFAFDGSFWNSHLFKYPPLFGELSAQTHFLGLGLHRVFRMSFRGRVFLQSPPKLTLSTQVRCSL